MQDYLVHDGLRYTKSYNDSASFHPYLLLRVLPPARLQFPRILLLRMNNDQHVFHSRGRSWAQRWHFVLLSSNQCYRPHLLNHPLTTRFVRQDYPLWHTWNQRGLLQQPWCFWVGGRKGFLPPQYLVSKIKTLAYVRVDATAEKKQGEITKE